MMKKRYAVCGVSNRALTMYIKPMIKNFSHVAEFVGMLDIDPLRFQICKEDIPETKDVATYMPDEFDKMIEEQKIIFDSLRVDRGGDYGFWFFFGYKN